MEKSGQPDTYYDDKNQQTNIDAPSQTHQGAPQQRPKTFKEKMSGKYVLGKSDTEYTFLLVKRKFNTSHIRFKFLSETFRMPQKKVPTEPFPPKFVNVDGNSLFFGEDPMNLKCPKCNQQTTTSTETTPGLLGKNKIKPMILQMVG